jgi:DNA-binding transcriptional ArsR family regulator
VTRHDSATHRRAARPRGGGDRRRSAIHRLYLRGPDAPRTAIVKRLKPGPADDPRGDDISGHLLVMQDLGDRRSLADLLLASDHHATVDRIEEPLAAQGIPLAAATRCELADLRGRLTGSASWPTSTHGDPCPDNNAVTTGGDLVHFDFEFARARPAMIDGAYLTVPFPPCWCVNASPPAAHLPAASVHRPRPPRRCPARLGRNGRGAASPADRPLGGPRPDADVSQPALRSAATRLDIRPRIPILKDVLKQTDLLDLLFQALANPSRRAMVERLSRGPASVSELAKPFAMSLPAVVQHVKVLETSGLVRSEKVGRVRTCRIEEAALSMADLWIRDRRTTWQSRLDRLVDYLAENPDSPVPEQHSASPHTREQS